MIKYEKVYLNVWGILSKWKHMLYSRTVFYIFFLNSTWFRFMGVGVLLARVCLHHTRAVPKAARKGHQIPLELGYRPLWAVNVGAGIQTQALWRNSKSS